MCVILDPHRDSCFLAYAYHDNKKTHDKEATLSITITFVNTGNYSLDVLGIVITSFEHSRTLDLGLLYFFIEKIISYLEFSSVLNINLQNGNLVGHISDNGTNSFLSSHNNSPAGLCSSDKH